MADPSNAWQQPGGGRVYRWGDETFPSVTTILDVINKPGLINWAARTVAEYAADNLSAWSQLDRDAAVDLLKGAHNRSKNRAADFGTAIHEACEAYSKGGHTGEWPEGTEKHMKTFLRFLLEFQPTIQANEVTVYSREHGYAGTFDILAWFGDDLTLLDIKTGKLDRFTGNPYPEAALQLNAYAHADFMENGLTEMEMPEIHRAAVLSLKPESYKLIPVRIDDEVFRGFLGAVELYKFQAGVSKTLFGRALIPGDVVPLVKGRS